MVRKTAGMQDVIDALNKAHVAMMGASITMRLAGCDIEKIRQIAGAALMISDDWIPALTKQATP